MKTLILAAMLGMATLVPTAVPTQAASLTITTCAIATATIGVRAIIIATVTATSR